MANPFLSLIGAGPGDPDLITLKAIKTIGKAKVILYDALVNESLLEYAAPDAIIRFVGKRYNCHSISQQGINDLIVDMAYSYGHVARLKGGDPFVFARAAEEIAAAHEAGIGVEVISGVSSALSVPASAFIPVTCRGIAESCWITTGTNQAGELSGDLELAARSSATVVILMAMSKLEEIMDIFASHGKRDTPVAIIQEGTTSRQRVITGTVKDILYRAEAAAITNPAVIVVGEVVNLGLKHQQNNSYCLHEKR
jgi:uroporphyrin-III C-methyltransferase